MTGALWCKIRIVVILAILSGLLLIACGNPSSRNIERGDQSPQVGSMFASSPIAPGPIVYLALGDSTGSRVGATGGGYPAQLFKRLVSYRPGSRLIDLCVSGATTSDLLRAQLDTGLGAAPQLVTLGIGINDIGHGLSLDEFSRNYGEILARLKNDTRATIVVTNLPDISSAPRIPGSMRGEYQQRIVEFNRRLAEVAAANGVIVFVSTA